MTIATKTQIVTAPYDLFGNPGTRRGAELLTDALREMQADNRRETQPIRAEAYQPYLRFQEIALDTPADYANWPTTARKLARQILRKPDFLLWLGGNHLAVLPVYEAIAATGLTDSLIVLFDAHLDVYHLVDCQQELSHGNFLMHLSEPRPAIIQIGHRDLFLPENRIARFFQATHSASRCALQPEQVRRDVQQSVANARRVFIDIDCDVFDPATFPAVGQPLPFGLTPREVLALLEAIGLERIEGISISEFDPARDQRDRSLETLVWLIEYLLLRRYESESNAPT